MSSIKIHAGDFNKGSGQITFSLHSIILVPPADSNKFLPTAYTINKKDIEEISLATEDNVKRIGGTLGWGVVGATLLGPVGLLAGLLLGGKGKNVTFIMKLKDGRKLLGTVDAKTYTKLNALIF